MNSALRSFLSAVGLGTVCFMLARATCDQVLMLFLGASLGWCLFVWRKEARKDLLKTRLANLGIAEAEYHDRLTIEKSVPIPVAPLPVPQEPVRTIYKFPIHQLTARTN